MIKKFRLSLLAFSTIVLLAACGDNGTIEDPATEPLDDPVEDPADPVVDPAQEDASDEDMEGPGAETP